MIVRPVGKLDTVGFPVARKRCGSSNGMRLWEEFSFCEPVHPFGESGKFTAVLSFRYIDAVV